MGFRVQKCTPYTTCVKTHHKDRFCPWSVQECSTENLFTLIGAARATSGCPCRCVARVTIQVQVECRRSSHSLQYMEASCRPCRLATWKCGIHHRPMPVYWSLIQCNKWLAFSSGLLSGSCPLSLPHLLRLLASFPLDPHVVHRLRKSPLSVWQCTNSLRMAGHNATRLPPPQQPGVEEMLEAKYNVGQTWH